MIGLALGLLPLVLGADTGKLEITVLEKGRDKPIPCRIHLKNSAGKAESVENLPHWNDHFVCPGTAELVLPAGSYSFEIERGPGYSTGAGSVNVSAAKSAEVKV